MTKLLQKPKDQSNLLTVDLLSLFPNYFQSPLQQSLLKRALAKGLLAVQTHDIRDFATNAYKQVDDTSYGGGPGMVLMPEPIKKAINSVKTPNSYVIYLSPQGNVLTSQKCKELAAKKHLILLCGHYEGIDERIIQTQIDEEISIGDYVVSSGCPAALVLLDAIARFIPGVVGKQDSTALDSFENKLFDYPHYTKPAQFEGQDVPQVLLEGDHQKINEFRRAKAVEKTKQIRPDLYWKWQFEQAHLHTITLFVADLAQSYQYFKKLFPIKKENDALILLNEKISILIQQSDTPSQAVAIRLSLSIIQIQKMIKQLQQQNHHFFLQLDEKDQIRGCTFEDIHGIIWHLTRSSS